MPNQTNLSGHGTSKRAIWRSGFVASSMLAAAVCLVATFSCSSHTDYRCGPGASCSCSSVGLSEDCILGCNGDNCRLDCSNTGAYCGTVCGDACDAKCHDTQQCSHSCQDHCTLECYGTPTCGGICGADCQYLCHDVTTCGVRVGPGSTVTCRSLSTCDVECEGACTVKCESMSTDNCNITCLGSNLSKTYGNGTYSCP